MIFKKKNGKALPSHVTEMAETVRNSGDGVTRREFCVFKQKCAQ